MNIGLAIKIAAAQRVVANTPRNVPQPVGVDELREALADLKVGFEREAQERYHRGEDGSDWQEAHRRVEALMRDAVAVAEDPVRQAARALCNAIEANDDEDDHFLNVARLKDALREALAQPAPPSLTEDECKAVLYGLQYGAEAANRSQVWPGALESAREKLANQPKEQQ